MTKAIYFDMDGTVADLYKVHGWLTMLRQENPEPYLVAEPMVDMMELAKICRKLQADGWKIGVITWLAKDSTKEYKRKTAKAKRFWLDRFFGVDFDEVHMVQYGTPKHLIAKEKRGFLVDDNEEVRNKWERHGGKTINAKFPNWVDKLARVC